MPQLDTFCFIEISRDIFIVYFFLFVMFEQTILKLVSNYAIITRVKKLVAITNLNNLSVLLKQLSATILVQIKKVKKILLYCFLKVLENFSEERNFAILSHANFLVNRFCLEIFIVLP